MPQVWAGYESWCKTHHEAELLKHSKVYPLSCILYATKFALITSVPPRQHMFQLLVTVLTILLIHDEHASLFPTIQSLI